jgi:peptidoglycan biosynthesis protein MviN/MurJ (putative lipid II flippase)
MTNQKKRDDEKPMTLIVCGIFTGALLLILFTAGNLFHMGVLLSIIAFGAVAACAVAWYQLIKNIQDPNKDYWRLLCIVFALAAIITIMGHRAGWLDRKQVQIDSRTEHALP